MSDKNEETMKCKKCKNEINQRGLKTRNTDHWPDKYNMLWFCLDCGYYEFTKYADFSDKHRFMNKSLEFLKSAYWIQELERIDYKKSLVIQN